jgi:choline dehydrogenase-like flavoprotein
VIIGSGAAGGRAAMDLTLAGARCLLLEAGSAYDAHSFPPSEMDYTARMFWGGGLEFSTNARLGFLRGKCLGGGTVVNQALMDRFDDAAWDDWRDRSGVDFFSEAGMAPHYDAAEKALALLVLPEERRNRSARLFIQALEAKGYGWAPLRRAEKDCAAEKGSDCLVCLGGCPRDSKQSSLVTTLKRAREHGLEIRTDFHVDHIDARSDQVRVVGNQAGRPSHAVAARAVLAAGALGTTGILLRSQPFRNHPALGRFFSCHPQFMSYALFSSPVDAHKGSFQTVKSQDPRFRQAGYKLENVAAPPGATALLIPGFGRDHLAAMKQYRHMACMEVCVRDEPAGRIRVDRRGRLNIDKPLTDQDRRRCREGLDLVMDLFQTLRPLRTIRCDQGFGLHLMGGAVMGVDPLKSVVGPDFRLHDSSRVFVADSSLFPSAPGINPCLTIQALAHRAAGHVASEA